MVKIDLITGFLGSGKTTFLRKYAVYLMEQGLHIGILENDFGAVNVDMMLLQDLEGEQCELEMISGGCDADCHKRRFKTKLIAMGMTGFDRVLVEPSGIYDVDEFFDTLQEEPLDRWYEIGTVIAIVDAKLDSVLSEEAEYLLASQTANAQWVVLSRSQEASGEEIAETIAHLNRVMEKFGCSRRFDRQSIWCQDWEEFGTEQFRQIAESGFDGGDHVVLRADQNQTFSSLYFMNRRMPKEDLCRAVKEMMADAACGRILRVKGFMQAGEDSWIELNATPKEISIRPIEKGQDVLIVIGEDLKEEAIEAYLQEK